MGKNQPKIDDFQPALYKEWGKKFAQFFGWINFNVAFWRLHRNALRWSLVVLAWVQPT